MTEGWRCPDCRLVLAPHVTEHRCDGTAGMTVLPQPPLPAAPMPQIIVPAPYSAFPWWSHTGPHLPLVTYCSTGQATVTGETITANTIADMAWGDV